MGLEHLLDRGQEITRALIVEAIVEPVQPAVDQVEAPIGVVLCLIEAPVDFYAEVVPPLRPAPRPT